MSCLINSFTYSLFFFCHCFFFRRIKYTSFYSFYLNMQEIFVVFAEKNVEKSDLFCFFIEVIKKGPLRILRRPLQTYEYRKLWDSCYPLLGIFYFSELIEFFLHVNEFLILLEKLDLFCNSACKGADSFPELFWKVNEFSGKNAVAILILFAALEAAEYPVAECFIEIFARDSVCGKEFIKFFYIFYIKGMQKISFFCYFSYKYSIIC